MLASVDTIKSILGIAEPTYDAQIALLVPQALQTISDYCNNRFLDASTYYTCDNMVLYKGSSDSYLEVSSADSLLEDPSLFQVGMDIYINGTVLNNGFYEIKSITETTLTVNGASLFRDESVVDRPVFIHRVKYPTGLVIPFAHYIKYLLTNQGILKKSETLPGGYSATFMSPDEVLGKLFLAYKRPYR